MSDVHENILLVFDDREIASGDIRNFVGPRRYGDIVVRRKSLYERLRESIPGWAAIRLIRLRTPDDIMALRVRLEASDEECGVCIIAGRTGFPDAERLCQFVSRLPYAEVDFTDRLYRPLIVYFRNAHRLVENWSAFERMPMHAWEQAWQGSERVQSVRQMDLANVEAFLAITCGSTAARHFNRVIIDEYYYTKISTDRRKMLAEYSFYGLVPEEVRPWLIQPFGYREEGDTASYKMLRYYLADAALQWVHGAFDPASFESFVARIQHFLAVRPRTQNTRAQSAGMARELFVGKLQTRVQQFLESEECRRVDALAASAGRDLALHAQVDRYLALYERFEEGFLSDTMVIGHGDLCFSNILYDKQRYLLKLIDPRGATCEADLWTHPLYDLCKLSHSVLGDYDFINNGMYRIDFTDGNDLSLAVEDSSHSELKELFRRLVKEKGHDGRIMRLGEASLFLSMLPLHIECPNKVLAFMIKARQILNEVEGG